MKSRTNLFCEIIAFALHPDKKCEYSDAEKQAVLNDLPALLDIGRNHKMLTAFLDGLQKSGISVPVELRSALRREMLLLCDNCYRMLDFTRNLLAVMSEEQVTYYVLKGITLLPCYPKPEYRTFGDVDILIPDPSEFDRIRNRLVSEGFHSQETFAEHHLELVCIFHGRPCCLELHRKVIADQADTSFNQKVHRYFSHISPVTDSFPEIGRSFCLLPHTEHAVYLLLHMLQHFLSSGFGLKLLCDWCLYLEHNGSRIDVQAFRAILGDLGLQRFCDAVTLACQRIGLSASTAASFLSESLPDEAYMELFMNEIFSSGEHGHADDTRMSVMSQNGRFRKYFCELNVHMKRRFHKLGKIVPLYPLLWVVTVFCFLWNNHFVRHVSTKDILSTANTRGRLVDELQLYKPQQHDF